MLECAICHKEYKHLGSHVAQTHQMLARDYKEMLGLDYKTPLVIPEISEVQREHNKANYAKVVKINLMEKGKPFRLGNGRMINTRYFSKQSHDRLRKNCTNGFKTGWVASPEWRKRQSERQKGMKHTEHTKQLLSIKAKERWATGIGVVRHHTPETKLKQSEARKRFWERKKQTA